MVIKEFVNQIEKELDNSPDISLEGILNRINKSSNNSKSEKDKASTTKNKTNIN